MSEQPKRPTLIQPPNFGFVNNCEKCKHIDYADSDFGVHDYIMCKKYGKIYYEGNTTSTETLGCSAFSNNPEIDDKIKITMDFYEPLFKKEKIND